MTNDYKPSADLLRHVDETLKLMTVLTGDRRFEEAVQTLPAEGGVSMCEVLDRVENRGIEKGLAQGKREGLAQGKREGLAQGKLEGLAQGKREGLAQGKLEGRLEGMTQIYYTEMHYSADQIAEELNAPVDTIQKLINNLLKK